MSFATLAVTVLLSAAPAGTSQQAGSNQHHDSHSAVMTCAHCAARHASAAKTGWGVTRRDNPHSTVVEDDSAPAHYATNDEINAAETGNPDSVEFRYATAGGGSEPGDLVDLEALEAENPHNAQPPKHVAVAVASASPAPTCTCMASHAPHMSASGKR